MFAAVILMVILAFVAMVVFFALFGAAFGLLFKALPFLLIGWVVVKLIQAAEGRGSSGTGLTTADRQWLDTRE